MADKDPAAIEASIRSSIYINHENNHYEWGANNVSKGAYSSGQPYQAIVGEQFQRRCILSHSGQIDPINTARNLARTWQEACISAAGPHHGGRNPASVRRSSPYLCTRRFAFVWQEVYNSGGRWWREHLCLFHKRGGSLQPRGSHAIISGTGERRAQQWR